MRTRSFTALALGGVLGLLAIPGCELDVPDLNNPSLGDLQNNPTAISVGAACTGLLAGNRRNHAAENGYVVLLGVLGREAYNFDGADPRYIGELLAKPLDPASPFGGNFWALPYTNIRLANIVLQVLDKVGDLTDENKAAIRGFVDTIVALDLLEVIATHDSNGAVIETDFDPLGPLPPIADRADTYARIVQLLERGKTELAAGGNSFPFAFSRGFAGFDTPATFTTFNRAIRARVAAYLEDYPTVLSALAESFIDDDPATADFDAGVYYSYSTKPGDTPNALINPNIYIHPSVEEEVAKTGDGVPDARFLRKVGLAKQPGTVGKRTSTFAFNKLYPDPEASVALIRNEELILLKAEALFVTGDSTAVAELNVVRTGSGRLAPLGDTPGRAAFIAALLYERRYSLLFEGHRWLDVRRLGQLSILPIFVEHDDDTGENTSDELNVRFPIPTDECNARPENEPACALGSQ